jgi:hypothetical protein
MKTYTESRNLFGTFTKNTATANLTFGDQMMNDAHRHICSMKDWYFLHRTRTMTTTAATQFKPLPYDVDQVESVYVTISTKRYTPKLITSREQWDLLNVISVTSDIPTYAFVYNGELGLWPIPSTSSNVITVNAKVRVIDLSIADYTTGNVSAIANGAVAMTGSGTSWTERMGGRWIRLTTSNTANTGDGVWYEVSGVASSTALTLVRSYGGTTIAAGSAAYTLGQAWLLPEVFQDLPVYYAAAAYWLKESDAKRASGFQELYDQKLKSLKEQYTAPITDLVVDDGINRQIINPNLTISL